MPAPPDILAMHRKGFSVLTISQVTGRDCEDVEREIREGEVKVAKLDEVQEAAFLTEPHTSDFRMMLSELPPAGEDANSKFLRFMVENLLMASFEALSSLGGQKTLEERDSAATDAFNTIRGMLCSLHDRMETCDSTPWDDGTEHPY